MPEYENMRRDADEIDKQIRALRAADDIDRRNLQDMRQAAADVNEPDNRYLESAFKQLNVVLDHEVRRRFDEVRTFHQTVVRNRERQLREEMIRIERSLEERARERERLGDRQAALLRTLNSGGALDALTALQYSLAREQAHLESLRHRFQAAQTLEASRREIDAKRLELEEAMVIDIEERGSVTHKANGLFNQYARRLYGDSGNPYLVFKPGKQRMKIETHIEDDGSRGIHSISDDLNKAASVGFDPDPYVIQPHLTDQPDGGLFGFRF